MGPHTPAAHDCTLRTSEGDVAAGLRVLLPEGWWTRLAPEAGSELHRWRSAGSQCWPREMPAQLFPAPSMQPGSTSGGILTFTDSDGQRESGSGEGAWEKGRRTQNHTTGWTCGVGHSMLRVDLGPARQDFLGWQPCGHPLSSPNQSVPL